MAAEQGTQHNPNILRSPDRLLAGTTAIVTGGSRDIGAAIVKNLALNGVNVVFAYRSDDDSASGVLDFVKDMPGNVQALKADLEKPEERSAFTTQAIELLGGRVDFLILSASGRSRKINQENSDQMITESFPHIKRGGIIVRMTSAIAHFGRIFENDPSIPTVYHKPATAKNEEEKHLRGRIDELNEKGIRLIMIAPPGVPSRNRDIVEELTRRATKGASSAIEIHNGVSDRLGLPREVSQNDIGVKILELLKDPNVKSGYTELFSGVFDAQTELARIYGIPQVYVNTLERMGSDDDRTHSHGRSIISVEQATRPNDPAMLDDVVRRYGALEGLVRITPEHASGHFTPESGLPLILPGHKQIRAAVDMITAIQRSGGRIDGKLRLVGFESAEFSSIVTADGITSLAIYPIRYRDGSYNVEIININTGETTASIKGLHVGPETESDTDTLLEDQIIEGAAQTVGITAADESERKMPLLTRIGRTEFTSGVIKRGEGIEYRALSEKDGKRGIKGSVAVYSEGRMVGTIDDIEAILVSEKTAARILSSRTRT